MIKNLIFPFAMVAYLTSVPSTQAQDDPDLQILEKAHVGTDGATHAVLRIPVTSPELAT